MEPTSGVYNGVLPAGCSFHIDTLAEDVSSSTLHLLSRKYIRYDDSCVAALSDCVARDFLLCKSYN